MRWHLCRCQAGGGRAGGARLAVGPRCPGGEAGGARCEKARGKEHTIEASPPPEIEEAMAWCLQWEEQEVEWARRAQDAATLEVVREAAGPLTQGPIGGLRGSLLGGWAKPATRGCGSLAAGSSGNLAATTTLTTPSLPPYPLRCPWLALRQARTLRWLSRLWLPLQPSSVLPGGTG